MGQRMFVAVVPPEQVRDDLAAFLEAREGMPWIAPEQWHLTLAFCASIPEHRIDELGERLATKAAKLAPFPATLVGAGTFPHPARASVLWAGVQTPADELARLSAKARAAMSSAGGAPDGKRFTPHLTLARLRRPIEATRWLRILDTYQGPSWVVEHIELVASHLREGPSGRPRHETVARVPLRGVGGVDE
jgi:2'-5' RNA ligase